MLLFSSVKLVALLIFIVMGVLGAMVYSASRGGWMRHGYFTIPAVLLIVIGLFISFQGLGSGLVEVLLGKNFETEPVATFASNGIAQISVLLVGAIVISRIAGQNLFGVFRLEGFHETPVLAYVLTIPLMLVAQILGEALSLLFEHFWKLFPAFYQLINNYETQFSQTELGMVTPHGPIDFFLILIFVAIVPAFCEETLFRGFAQSNIERSGKWHTRPIIALILTSLLFALAHVSLFKLPGYLALGLTLGWVTYRTNNLFTGALAHAANNGMIVVALYMNPTEVSTSSNSNLVGSGDMSGGSALVVAAVLLPVMGILVYAFNRVTAHLDARHNAERELQTLLTEDAGSLHDTISENHE